jgi:Actin like proteins N terminal domain
MIIGLDVGFGYTKSVTAAGSDVFPSVIGEWTPGAFRLDVGLGDSRSPHGIEAVEFQGRGYLVGDRALRVAHRRFVGLSRAWMEEPAYWALA